MTSQRAGFSLIEVIVAMLILTVGVLAMGGATGYILTQVRSAQLRTDRMTAVNQAAEQLRAIAWNDLESACAGDGFDVPPYAVSCHVSQPQGVLHLKRIDLVSTGPGFRGGRVVQSLTDTMVIGIARPVDQ